MLAGLKGYEKIVYNSKKQGGRKIRRTAKESSATRALRKLTAKTEWFRDRKRGREEEDDFDDRVSDIRTKKKSRITSTDEENLPTGWKHKNKDKAMPEGLKEQKAGREIKTRSLMFVVGSIRGELTSNLRQDEKDSWI